MQKLTQYLFFIIFIITLQSNACAIVYFIDKNTGNIYIANNEDYWLDTKAYVQKIPDSKKGIARMWYGWDDFAQGGVNKVGLFFDGAVTPKQKIPESHKGPNGRNIGDEILASCSTVNQALLFLEKEKIAIANGHMMFGDKTGNAVVVEWVNGKRNDIFISDNYLIATNYLLSKPEAGNFPCYRFQSIEQRIKALKEKKVVDFRSFGNTIGGAAQIPQTDSKTGKKGGTLYSSFINLSTMEMYIVPKLENQKLIRYDLEYEFNQKKKFKTKLY